MRSECKNGSTFTLFCALRRGESGIRIAVSWFPDRQVRGQQKVKIYDFALILARFFILRGAESGIRIALSLCRQKIHRTT